MSYNNILRSEILTSLRHYVSLWIRDLNLAKETEHQILLKEEHGRTNAKFKKILLAKELQAIYNSYLGVFVNG